MKFIFNHNNINVTDIEKSVAFYKKALNLDVVRRHDAANGSFTLIFLGDRVSGHNLELTWLRDKEGAYDLGDNELHLALRVDDYEAAHQRHQEMKCVCYENPAMGLYFINDPDGYWIEILPQRR
jgi:lactoylglutathione lyase